MPTLVDIPKVGRVSFPDTMTDSDIVNAIQTRILPKENPSLFSRIEQAVGATTTPASEEAAIAAQNPAAKGVAEAIGESLTPKNLAIGAGLAALTAIAPPLGAATIGVLGAKGAGQAAGAGFVALQQGDVKETAKQAANLTLSGLMAAAPIAKFATDRSPIEPVKEIKPPADNKPVTPPPFAPEPASTRTGDIGITQQPQTSVLSNLKAIFDRPLSEYKANIRTAWKSFAMESLPRTTQADRVVGEAGVRAASARFVARQRGELFADKVLEGTGVDPIKFGAALTEDNLRSLKSNYMAEAERARSEGNPEDAIDFQNAAESVASIVGEKNSPFKTESDYQSFLDKPETKVALERHTSLWQEQKDPLFRQANDLDPEHELPSRGEQTGARINLKGIREGETSGTSVGAPARKGIRQLATIKRLDPFARRATGMSDAYEIDYREIMAHGFEREMPVAAQHEFIRNLIESGNAKVTASAINDVPVKGQQTRGFLLSLRPWSKQWLQVPERLADEYAAVMGLTEKASLGAFTKAGEFATRQSVLGLAEGSTHFGNLLTQVFTGLGPTANPLVNALAKSLGRVDLLYSLPKVFLKAFTDHREEMVKLAEIGAAKTPYGGLLGRGLLNPIDKGVRLVSADLYKSMADAGWVENTETGLREFVNQVGQYNKQLQPKWIRTLRETQVQPFVTAGHTFNVMGLRRMALQGGATGTSGTAKLALKADILGGWLGFITLAGGLNYLLSGSVKGPPGTKLGDVGWIDSDGQTKTIPLARIAGFERGLRVTGIGPAATALMRGETPGEALRSGGEAVANAALGYATGPMSRTLFLAGTGKTPSIPSFQEAPVVPPSDELNVIRNQVTSNMATALQEMNPLVDSAVRVAKAVKRGASTGEIVGEVAQKQLSRYSPRSLSEIQSNPNFAKIVRSADLHRFADYIATETRKLPVDQRQTYVEQQLVDLEPADRRKVKRDLKIKRILH